MYPIVRVIKEAMIAKTAAPLPVLGRHVTTLRCWPQDLDYYFEMNNGRILTILDIGRTGLAQRIGLLRGLRQNGWGLTIAGSSVRYRKRIRPFVKFRIVTKTLGWDPRFFYIEQTIWIGETCATQALFRAAVTDREGIVDPARVFASLGLDQPSPVMPDWVQAWIAADNTRPWPPMDNGR